MDTILKTENKYFENFLVHQECNGTPDLIFSPMNLKVIVLESDLCAEVGGYLDHEGLNRLMRERGLREEDIILYGQQPEADPIISARLSWSV